MGAGDGSGRAPLVSAPFSLGDSPIPYVLLALYLFDLWKAFPAGSTCLHLSSLVATSLSVRGARKEGERKRFLQ